MVEIIRAGADIGGFTLSDHINKHFFDGNDGNVTLIAESTDSGTQTLVLESSLDVDDLPLGDLTVYVPPGGTVAFGGFRRKTFNQDAGNPDDGYGTIWVNPSVSSTLKLKAIKTSPAG